MDEFLGIECYICYQDFKERLRGGQIDVEALVDQVTYFYLTFINCVFSQPDDGLVEVEAKLLLRDLLEAVLVQVQNPQLNSFEPELFYRN